MSIKLDFPYYVILKASAGSGKTYVLTERFVYFLLSEDIPKNNIKNILAITFSNNAAYEMKSRILELLKSFYIDNPNNSSKIAERVVDEILSNYSDFQVKTIDSFMTNIFKASAYDFEFNPDVEILMNKDSLTKYAYNLFLKDVGVNSDMTELFEEMIEILEESLGFMWDPAEEIYQKIKKIYDEVLKAVPRNIAFDESLIDKRKNMEIELSNIMEKILQKVNSSGLERNYKNKIFDEFPRILKQRRFVELIEKGVKALPVKKNKELQKVYEEIEALWMRFINLVSEYTELYSRCYYMPYIKIFERFHYCLQQIKKKEGKIFIEDINKYLSEVINTEYVPEIYFRIGAKIYHFFIDEFQDTSLLQWLNLKPLIENSLSEGGSLFVVGDTKQAIYNFRGADYKVMKELEETNVFPSAKKIIEKLNKNYRSRSRIVQFVHDFFRKIIYLNDKYKFAAKLTELDSCEQIPYEDFKEEGYIEVRFLKDEEELKSSLKEIIEDLQTRNYSLRDMAIVASKNTQVEMLSFLLSELGVSFLSYSSLDVRKRKITWEIIHLLQFLDSPLDDFSFSVFIMGDIYKRVLEASKKNIDINEFVLTNREHSPLYKAFEKQFSQLWREHFERLFRLTGYLPIYDLVSEVINSFRLFEIMPEEEATFMKILEIIRYFEQKGVSSIKNFINFFSTTVEDDTIWDITLPVDTEAVKVMTIHKAKGLQFPITIVFLERQRHPKDGMVIEPLEGIFKINENMAEKSEKLKEIKDNEIISDTVDLLNRLYVAYTRAEKELYILCKVNEKDEKVFPFNILSEYLKPCGQKTENEIKQISTSAKKIFHCKGQQHTSVSDELIHLKEKARGELIHKVLSCIEFIEDDLDKRVDLIIKELGVEFDIKERVIKTIKNSELTKYFVKEPERKIFNEFELCDDSGSLHRIDKLVIDKDYITVIDYKTGVCSEKYDSQIKLYIELVSKIFPEKRVKGAIYYIDSEKVVWI